MSKDPAVLFYTSDFIAGTLSMTNEQRGKYILLLCLQHQKGHLSRKDMMNICKTYDKDVFDKFIKDKDGNYYNLRMDTEILKRKNYSESRRKNRTHKITYVEHMENENEDVNINKDIKNNAFNFDEIWSKYPKRLGKKQAEKHFKSSVKTDKDWEDINKALINYCQTDNVKSNSKYIQNGSTWFNNWRDWIDKEIKPEPKSALAMILEKQNAKS